MQQPGIGACTGNSLREKLESLAGCRLLGPHGLHDEHKSSPTAAGCCMVCYPKPPVGLQPKPGDVRR